MAWFILSLYRGITLVTFFIIPCCWNPKCYDYHKWTNDALFQNLYEHLFKLHNIHIHIHIHIHVHIHIHTHIHTYAHTDTHTHAHAHIHTHADTIWGQATGPPGSTTVNQSLMCLYNKQYIILYTHFMDLDNILF